jgi:hypothetical protein
MSTPRDVLLRLLRSAPGVPDTKWLEQALPRAGHGDQSQLLAAYTSAARALGLRPLIESSGSVATLLGEFYLGHWSLEDAGRLLCLLERAAVIGDGEEFLADATACYEQGDAREQASWLRAVGLLPRPDRFLPIVIDACRTNILTVFQAVACDNPYPARHFPELNFNQLVLKSLFNGTPLARIIGLETRANANLARMASDYAAERRAAGRTVPIDLPLATIAAHAQRIQ